MKNGVLEVPKQAVHGWRDSFNNLQKDDQDLIVWELANRIVSNDRKQTRLQWHLLGNAFLCFDGLCMVTACTRRLRSFRAIIKQGGCSRPPDLRKRISVRCSSVGEDVNQHFTWLYHSLAETLPDIGDGTKYDIDLPDDAPCNQVAVYAKPMNTSVMSVATIAGSAERTEGKRFLPPGGWFET